MKSKREIKHFIIGIILLTSGLSFAQTQFSEIGNRAGAFSRMGFGARGIGMGNAMSAVTEGNLVSYYNPALGAFQEGNSAQTGYSFLSLDRSLNFLNYTKKFAFGKVKEEDGSEHPRSYAGISVGIINAGVGNIDARDNQGNSEGELSTSENQFFMAVSNRFSDKLAIGIAFKFYYYSLYEDLSTSSLGFDIGAIYSFNSNLTFSVMISDLNSKYEWDTSDLFGSDGRVTEDKFPILKKIGVSYKFDDPKIIAAVEFESSNAETNYLRFGGEYNIFNGLFLRAGIDRINLSNSDTPIRPAFGFTYLTQLDSIMIGFDYAFMYEPYAAYDQHIIGVNFNF